MEKAETIFSWALIVLAFVAGKEAMDVYLGYETYSKFVGSLIFAFVVATTMLLLIYMSNLRSALERSKEQQKLLLDTEDYHKKEIKRLQMLIEFTRGSKRNQGDT